MTLAKRIRDGRYAKGWGPDELAQRADISRTALYQIECGKTETPRAGTIRRIARALDVSVECLLGHEGDVDAMVSPAEAHEMFSSPIEPATYARTDTPAARSVMDRLNATSQFRPRPTPPTRETEILLKLKEVLASPLGEGVGRIVEESYRLLPVLRNA